jgi:hypothetical protein
VPDLIYKPGFRSARKNASKIFHSLNSHSRGRKQLLPAQFSYSSRDETYRVIVLRFSSIARHSERFRGIRKCGRGSRGARLAEEEIVNSILGDSFLPSFSQLRRLRHFLAFTATQSSRSLPLQYCKYCIIDANLLAKCISNARVAQIMLVMDSVFLKLSQIFTMYFLVIK